MEAFRRGVDSGGRTVAVTGPITDAFGPERAGIAWLAVPVMFLAVVVLYIADLPFVGDSPLLAIVLGFLFTTASSVLVAVLVGGTYTARGHSGHLLLGCGVLFWGTSGLAGPLLLSESALHSVTVHNLLVLLSGLCQFAGIILMLKPGGDSPKSVIFLVAAYAGVLLASVFIVSLSMSNAVPLFFIEGWGGKPIRQLLLGVTVSCFLGIAFMIRSLQRAAPSAFLRWYRLAVLLMAIGIFGLMLQTSVGSAMNWAGRSSMYLGGIYLLVAGVQSLRETRAWRLPVEEARRENEDRWRAISDLLYDYAYSFRVDEQGTATLEWVTHSLKTMIGFGDEELSQPDFWRQLIHEEDVVAVEAHRARLLSGAQDLLEFRIRTRLGECRWLRNQARGQIDPRSRRVVRLFGAAGDITEQKQVEAALRESEALNRKILWSLPAHVAVIDQKCNIILVNGAWEAFARENDAPEALALGVGINYCEACREAIRQGDPEPEKALAGIEEVLKGTSDYFSYEYPCHSPRQKRWFVMVVTPLESGGKGGAVIAHFNVTEQREAESALRESDNRLRLASTAARLGVFEWDFTTDSGHWENRRIYEIFGREEHEGPFSRTTFLEEVIHPDDRPRFVTALTEAPSEEFFCGNCRIRRRNDGEWRWIEFSGRFERETTGGPIRLVGVVADVTEQKEWEKAMQMSKSRTELLASVAERLLRAESPQRVIDDLCHKVMDHLDCQFYVNYLVDESTGDSLVLNSCGGFDPGTAESFRQIRFGDPVCGKVAEDRMPAIIESASETGAPGTEALAKFGIEAYCCLPLIAEGDILGTLAFGTRFRPAFDKDEVALMKSVADQVAVALQRLRDEKRILELNATLEKRVRERTEQLETSNKELESFCYAVSHDLRGPLRALDGFSEALLQDYAGALDEAGRDFLQRVRNNSQYMGRLLDDLLKLSRLSRTPMSREPVDLSGLARHIAEDLSLTDRGRKVRWEIGEGLGATGDPGLLRIALENLMQNAWKFTGKRPEAVIEVGIEVVPAGPCGAPVRAFYVRDNGVGFDMQYAHKLFGAFQRLHSVSEYPGTGIGLATVQRIVLRHGGQIWTKASPDRGATFFFTLANED